MSDDIYTPDALARVLLELSRQQEPRHIADFSVGAGSLLSAAKELWPKAKLYGVDLNPGALQEAKNLLSELEIFDADFLSEECLQKTSALIGAMDLIVLNPPFTCRGAAYELTDFEGSAVKSSKAMAFLLRSCLFLAPRGEILAIVPRSCLFSLKDEKARRAICGSHLLEDLGAYQSPGFRKASVSVHLIRVTRLTHRPALTVDVQSHVNRIIPKHGYSIVFMRGSHAVSCGTTNSKGPSLIHTTELFNFEISLSRRRAVHLTKQVSGRSLMLPRVGRPSLEKIAFGHFANPVVPSDCIICVKTVPPGNEQDLQSQIKVFWPLLRDSYSGTCAPYLTLEGFRAFAIRIGFEASLESDPLIWNPLGTATEEAEASSLYRKYDVPG